MISLDEHLVDCAECRQILSGLISGDIDHARSQLQNDDLEHPDYNLLEAYVDLSCDDTDREVVESHLRLCSACAADVREMQAMRKQGEGEKVSDHAVVHFRPFYSTRMFRYAALAAAAIILVLVLKITREPVAPGKQARSTPAPQHPVSAREPWRAALQDQGVTIAIDAKGKLVGADRFPPAYQEMARAALTDQKLVMPGVVTDLTGGSGALLGETQPGSPFQVLAPIGVVVESTRPQFQWKPLAGAKYQVRVFDQKFHLVATSDVIRGTSWTPDRDLVRSNIYIWSVTANKDGQEIESPAPPSPEARFQVLDTTKLQEIQTLRNAGSHMLLGLACANAGLIPEARREFQILLDQNPNSSLVRNLLASLPPL